MSHFIHQRYGTYVRIAPGHVSIADPAAIPIVYGFGEGALRKSQYYDAFVAGTPSVFSSRNNATHARKRRIMSHAFSLHSLQSFSPSLHSMLETFVCKLDTICKAAKPIDMVEWLNYLGMYYRLKYKNIRIKIEILMMMRQHST
jgi:benzoate 4-monooxygenase